MIRHAFLLSAVLICSLTHAAAKSTTATPPTQPATGPGGLAAPHSAVTVNSYGSGDTQYWIFEPAEPRPASAPVVIFMHGYGAMEPDHYQAWIDHIVKRGNIVIYPRYQSWLLTAPSTYLGNATAALKSAFIELSNSDHVQPVAGKVAIVGHSYGGVLTANIAATAAASGLPQPGAVMCVEPGTGGFQTYEDYSKIPAGTLLLCIAGKDDTVVGALDAGRIYFGATNVGKKDRNFIQLISDDHGTPALVADHFFPVTLDRPLDAFDWYGGWKWFDALSDAAFFGTNREYALGGKPQQKFMGKWSDGRKVVQPKIVTRQPPKGKLK
jgi:dienelactone hydrolase